MRARLAGSLALALGFGAASPAGAAGYLFVGTDTGVVATVTVLADHDLDKTYEAIVQQFQPFGGYKGGVRVAAGDFDGDGSVEVAMATGAKGGARVDVYDVLPDGTLGARLDTFAAFEAPFSAGLLVAAGDLNGDGIAELVVSGDAKSDGRVRVYSDADRDGQLSDDPHDELTPFGAGWKGGVVAAVGDVNNDGRGDLVLGHGPAGASHVVVLRDVDMDGLFSDETPAEEFDAFEPKYKGGVTLGIAQFESMGSNGADIAVGTGKKRGDVTIFSDVDVDGLAFDDPPFQTVAAYPSSKGGVRLVVGDTDGSGTFVELVTVPGKGPLSELRIFDDTVDAGSELDATPIDASFPAGDTFKRGLFVAFGKTAPASYAFLGPRSIPDGSTTIASIFVPGSAGIVRDLDAFLAIGHTFVGDLDVTLTHVPSGIAVTLFTDVAGTDEGLIAILSDESGTDIGTADNPNDGPVVGSFNPEGAALLSAFDGLDASGEWQLTIVDDTASDIGNLYRFDLTFQF